MTLRGHRLNCQRENLELSMASLCLVTVAPSAWDLEGGQVEQHLDQVHYSHVSKTSLVLQSLYFGAVICYGH